MSVSPRPQSKESNNPTSAAPAIAPFTTSTPFGPDLSNGLMQTVLIRCSWGGDLTAAVTANYATAKRVAVFIPGFTGSKEDFLSFFPHLVNKMQTQDDWAFVAYSQRGQADSSRPQGDHAYALEDFANDAQEVLIRLGAQHRPVDVLGHSFGGVVARRLAIACPTLVHSLTLMSSGAQSIAQSAQTRAGIEAIRTFGSSVIFKSSYPQLRDEAQQDPYIEMYRQRAHGTSVNNLLSIAAILADYDDVTPELKATNIPTAIMFGDDDPVWPHSVYEDEADQLGITPTTFSGAGHSAQLDAPEALAQALCQFWSGLKV